MLPLRSAFQASIILLCTLTGVYVLWARETPQQRRERLVRSHADGNYKVAFEGLRKLALDTADDPKQVGTDLELAVECLEQLGRTNEIDDFREAVVGVHGKNWRLLYRAAVSLGSNSHHGVVVAGKFQRTDKGSSTSEDVSSFERDRVRAIQLYQRALPLADKEADKDAVAGMYLDFAQMVLNGGHARAEWKLQVQTDLSALPDYDQNFDDDPTAPDRGAPVDERGNPVYYSVPKSYAAAVNDGERWRWLLARAAKLAPGRANEADWQLAAIFRRLYGIQTLGPVGWNWAAGDGALVVSRVGQPDTEAGEKKAGIFDLRSLKDNETRARLADGVKRFTLPDEVNWIKICERIAKRGKSPFGEHARQAIAREYEARWQYAKAADAWRKLIAEYGAGPENAWRERLNQIVGNWGLLQEVSSLPAGKKPVVNYQFRNGKKATFEAHAIDLDALLTDVKGYLERTANDKARQVNLWAISSILLKENEKKYTGASLARWKVDLKPREEHLTTRLAVTAPVEKAGAYVLTARMEGGNVDRTLLWLADTVLVEKALQGKRFWYVADAVSGKPVADAKLDFFCFVRTLKPDDPSVFQVKTVRLTRRSNADGQVILTQAELPPCEVFMVVARKAKDGAGGADRLAYLGFSHPWSYDWLAAGGWLPRGRNDRAKVFFVTDRPVYRPGHVVRFKAWVGDARHDQPDASNYANTTFDVTINNSKDENVFAKRLTTDAYGGLHGEYTLPADAPLGHYPVQVGGGLGGGSFRVEEYKKPEFEVKVEGPARPVRLGKKIEATIQARYYFGAPVSRAKVKYKVVRNTYTSTWYPSGAWDWLYGKGYWWFASDYLWYPGWREWGRARPLLDWWGGWRQQRPEVVLENEVPIGADGTVKVTIDTTPAKELHPDRDHEYTITAEVVDESRRTITGTGSVLVSRRPFQVIAWADRGHYEAGDTVKAGFAALSLDDKPVAGKGELALYQVHSGRDGKPVEKLVQSWRLDPDAKGQVNHPFKAVKPGQYRLSYKVTDAGKEVVEGGHVFVVHGAGFEGGKECRFNDLELVPDKREYAPGEKLKLLINTNQADAAVLLFVRPKNGVYQSPRVVRIKGKSAVEEIAVVESDTPNFFVEALTVHGGRVHTEVREVIVPPVKRVLNVVVLPSLPVYKPGQKATVKVRLTDLSNRPFTASTVMTVYDRSVEYISQGSNVPEIKAHFWEGRAYHHPLTTTSLERRLGDWLNEHSRAMIEPGLINLLDDEKEDPGPPGARGLSMTGGWARFDWGGGALGAIGGFGNFGGGGGFGNFGGGGFGGSALGALGALGGGALGALGGGALGGGLQAGGFNFRGNLNLGAGGFAGLGIPAGTRRAAQSPNPPLEPVVRKNFRDTAFWHPNLTTNKDGIAEVTFPMPEQLTGWKIKVWALGHGTKVGEGEIEVRTKKDLLLRMQAPRFFVQKDEVVLSANVHNYLKRAKDVAVSVEVEGGTLELTSNTVQDVKIPAGSEKRVDWRVKVKAEGPTVVRMKAVTDEESDAMQMSFPSYVHGMLKTESFSGIVRPEKDSGKITITVPAERRVDQTRLELRFTPTLAGAMVDALPYLVDYPYGCTEQTLNRFLPTVITQRTLQRMKLDLKVIQQKRTHRDPAATGDGKPARGWTPFDRNPVFEEAEVRNMVQFGVKRLASMQCSDGGWGWFSGWREHSWAHTTAVVVHGLQIANECGAEMDPGLIQGGVNWLKGYQAEQVRQLRNAPTKTNPYKEHADSLDALVIIVLADAGVHDAEMRDYLYRDRTHLGVYAKALFGLALHKQKEATKLAMVLENIEQFVVEDKENQTTYLKLPADDPWWYWYGSETEANAYYLKLLSATNPKDKKAAGLVKYLLNNRKHATYWNSTRDTALCIEAMADYLKASGEDKPDLTVEVLVDGKKRKEVKIDSTNLFTVDNKLVLAGNAVGSGKHAVEIRKMGTGPVYFNAYLTNFTLEDNITRAGLEVKVNRKYYKLERIANAKVTVSGGRGQAADQKVEKYKRIEMQNLDKLKSGDLVEIELEIDSKNDYEYLLFEDMKASGCEPMLVRSGYNPNDLGAYMEMRDDRVCFFVRRLARGKHSVAYRVRAEIPGQFSALPARASAMYAPELKGNSDEIKIVIED